ncbi:AT-rich interactive domain-containing protein 4B isoform X3 [Triplophysa rosa]|uniref:AT-rich interactive domain-containing protein 4B isoform X3 n=1 Tax=Triplophysa rosa TaxID=992332 RepID=UPI00254634F5|nr:AT-rich interactive domain-containing protein 4B isoform X3 [Triplophysa rosa]
MKTLEEPPYLTVGTDVSAKYRGAFCEAKIKTAKRLVKAKVTFRPDSFTAEVHDEHIRGVLKVGAVVEARNQDGIYQEAIINKLTDASLYTVVFDDGDEKTLRRSSLCLKGARHFAESETLDRLPLTNPEHFGTPVIGKKRNRGGRRSNPIQEEDPSSSSSEEEEGDQQQNEELYGKAVCVDAVITADKKKGSWYPALVISPDCHEDVTLKKDNVFVRSFKDGKFYTVFRKDVRELNEEKIPKADAALKPALDAACEFQRDGTVPSTWRTEVKDESSSSEEDAEEEEEEREEEEGSSEEEEEVEPFPEERENFLQQLYKFMEDRGTPINKRPVLGYRNLDLFKLYRLVHKLGGFDNIDSGSIWKQVYQDLGIPVLNSAAGYNVKCAYRKYLHGFEDYCASTGITFRMDLPYKTGEKTDVKTEETAGASNSVSSGEELKVHKEPEASDTRHVLKEEETDAAGPCEGKVDINRANEDDDHHAAADEEENDEELHKEGLTADGPVAEGGEEEPCDESDDKDLSGYDEWIRADKIIRPATKNVSKIKHRKKIKNKSERERIERLTDRDDLPPSKNRVGRLSKANTGSDVFSKLEECEDNENQQTPDKTTEITSILNGLPASESSTDDSEREEDGEADHDEEQRGGRSSLRKGVRLEPPRAPQQWKSGGPSEGFKTPAGVDNTHELTVRDCPEPAKRKAQFESEVTKKKKAEALGERTLKSQTKGKSRGSRASDWLPGSSPKKLEERGAGEDGGPQTCSSSEDEADPSTDARAKEEPRGHSKTKTSSSKKYNGLKEKNKAGCSGFWDVPEKRAKMSAGTEERAPSCRTKGQKDVWSSIQVQWPKKTLKDLFSDSDTEAANSPPPAVTAPNEPCTEPAGDDENGEEQQETIPGEHPGSGTNSVLNTPPTTPESPAVGEGPAEVLAEVRPSLPPASPQPGPLVEERTGGRSESDSSTVEVESLAGEIQEMHQEEGEAGSPSKAFDGNLSCNSNSNCSVSLSHSSLQESDQKAKASSAQKRHRDSQGGGASKKHKRSHKSMNLHPKKNRKAAHSSDSEDQSINESTAKSPSSKSNSDLKSASSPRCSGRTTPSGHRYHKHVDHDHSHTRDQHGRSKWSLQMSDLEKMSSPERITFLQEKLQDIRNHYLLLKSEVASIDRRRKRMKKKERESATAGSSSSSSPSSSSLTAAVMLTLANPTVSGASQNSGLSVECR